MGNNGIVLLDVISFSSATNDIAYVCQRAAMFCVKEAVPGSSNPPRWPSTLFGHGLSPRRRCCIRRWRAYLVLAKTSWDCQP